MRTIVSSFLVFSLLFVAGCRKEPQEQSREELRGTITVSGAWALYPMVVRWAEEFQKIHRHVKIDVAAGGAGVEAVLYGHNAHAIAFELVGDVQQVAQVAAQAV